MVPPIENADAWKKYAHACDDAHLSVLRAFGLIEKWKRVLPNDENAFVTHSDLIELGETNGLDYFLLIESVKQACRNLEIILHPPEWDARSKTIPDLVRSVEAFQDKLGPFLHRLVCLRDDATPGFSFHVPFDIHRLFPAPDEFCVLLTMVRSSCESYFRLPSTDTQKAARTVEPVNIDATSGPIRNYSTDEIHRYYGKDGSWISRQKKDKTHPFPRALNGNKRPQIYNADEVDLLMDKLTIRKKREN